MKRFVPLLTLSFLFSSMTSLGSTSPAYAACSNPARDGKTIGRVVASGISVDVKNVSYPAGGQLDPPRSPLNVGLSVRHQPLNAEAGSSILVWHINYSGCVGKLNVLMNKKRGYSFSVVDEDGISRAYQITSVIRIRKGNYRPEWFRLDGPRQLVFVTCVGVVVDGHYLDNLVIIAQPK